MYIKVQFYRVQSCTLTDESKQGRLLATSGVVITAAIGYPFPRGLPQVTISGMTSEEVN
jgi:hypothetical protein